jgi:hypothetical protein
VPLGRASNVTQPNSAPVEDLTRSIGPVIERRPTSHRSNAVSRFATPLGVPVRRMRQLDAEPAFENTPPRRAERYGRMLGTADAHLPGTSVRRSAACGVSGPLIRANGVQDRSMLGQLLRDTRDQLRFDADHAFQRVDYFPG